MKEIELTFEEKLALQSFIYKELFFQSQIELLKIEFNNYITILKEKYSNLGEIIEIDAQNGKIKIRGQNE